MWALLPSPWLEGRTLRRATGTPDSPQKYYGASLQYQKAVTGPKGTPALQARAADLTLPVFWILTPHWKFRKRQDQPGVTIVLRESTRPLVLLICLYSFAYNIYLVIVYIQGSRIQSAFYMLWLFVSLLVCF